MRDAPATGELRPLKPRALTAEESADLARKECERVEEFRRHILAQAADPAAMRPRPLPRGIDPEEWADIERRRIEYIRIAAAGIEFDAAEVNLEAEEGTEDHARA